MAKKGTRNLKGDSNSLNHLNPKSVFCIGFTKAVLNSFGKAPVLRNKFTIRVIIGIMLWTQWGKKLENIR